MAKVSKNIFYFLDLFIPVINNTKFIIDGNMRHIKIVLPTCNNRLTNTIQYPTKNTTTINIITKIKKIKIYDVYDMLKKIIDNSTKIDLLNYKKRISLLKIHLENSKNI